jgi:hypothetical protein
VNANELISLAISKGFSIGRYKKGIYYITKNGKDEYFNGTWSQFVKYVKAI